MILDVFGFELSDPVKMSEVIDQIPGVVAHGLFIKNRADIVLVGSAEGVRVMHPGDALEQEG